MHPAPSDEPAAAPAATSEGPRLHSWKEIAAYLQHDVRTVQRWEKHDGLPIHRRPGNVGGVFAYRAQLDAWWTSKEDRRLGNGSWFQKRSLFWMLVPVIAALAGFAAWSVRDGTPANGEPGSPPPSLSTGVVPLIDVSPDRRHLTFSNPVNGNLAAVDLASGAQRDLTTKRSWFDSRAYARSSRIAPDNRQVAYAWVIGNGRHELRTTALSGPTREDRLLYGAENATYVAPSAWSPDSRWLLVTTGRFDGSCSIAVVSVPGGSSRLLGSFATGCPELAGFTGDGRELVWSRAASDREPNRDVYARGVDDSRERPLIQHAANDRAVGWTADGRALLFTSDRSGTQDLWLLPIRDGRPQEPVLVRRELGRALSAGTTSDGSMYYASSVALDDVYVAALDPVTGSVLEQPARVGQAVEGANAFPDWSADGEFLAFVRRRDAGPSGTGPPQFTIVVRSSRDGTEREVVPRTAFWQIYRPRWSPDGRTIVVTGTDDARRFGLYTIAVADGAVRRIETTGAVGKVDPQPAWGSGGTSMLFVSPGALGSSVVSRELATGRERVVFPRGGTIALARDGRTLAVGRTEPSRNRSVLTIVPRDGPPRVRLELDSPDAFATTLAWSADARYLFFTKHAPRLEEAVALWRVPAAVGDPHEVGLKMPGLRDVRVHPDGRHVAFFAQQTRTEVWLVENLPLPGK